MAPYLDGPTHDAEDVQEFMAQHSEFHTVLGSLANNTVLQLTMQAYGKIVSHHVAVASDPRRLRNMLGEDHRAIAQAVSSGHHNRARELMVDHIRAVVAFTRDGLGAKVNDYIEWL